MKSKFDWERVHEEKLMDKQGSENYNYKKPLDIINRINCAHCGIRLENNKNRTELEHLAKCSVYLKAVKLGRIANKFGLYRKPSDYSPLSLFLNKPDFPFCAIGEFISTKTFIGKASQISCDGKKITLIDDCGNVKQFQIEFLLKQ